jgi:hypothetical protein
VSIFDTPWRQLKQAGLGVEPRLEIREIGLLLWSSLNLLAGLSVAVGTMSGTRQSAGSVLMLDKQVGVRAALQRFISTRTPLIYTAGVEHLRLVA